MRDLVTRLRQAAAVASSDRARLLREAADEIDGLAELVRHCWVHGAYIDCGFMQMTTPQKRLYCEVIGVGYETRLAGHLRLSKRAASMFPPGWADPDNDPDDGTEGEGRR